MIVLLLLLMFLAAGISVAVGGGEVLTMTLFVVFLIAIIAYAVSKVKKTEETFKKQDRYLDETQIQRDIDYKYDGYSVVRYIVDNSHRSVYIYLGDSAPIKLPFSEITGCEILVDSEVTGGVGRAVVGGAIAGGAGAIIGATTAKKNVLSYKIVIYRRNLSNPSTEIVLINTDTPKNNPIYKQAVDFSSKVNASIKAIISTIEKEEQNVQRQIAPAGNQLQIEESSKISSAPKYLPGMEPDNIQNLLGTFFAEVDNMFPDKKILWQDWNHARWDKAAGYLCKNLGYTRGKDFLEAYGYTVIQ